MSSISESDAKPANWRKKVSGMHISASAGNYRLHRSGEGAFTAYQFDPFIPLGCFDTVPEAQKACLDHWEKHYGIS